MSHKNGFSLIELLVYIAIFAVSAVFLVAILGTATRVQIRQKSAGEVNHQVSFVAGTIERLVQESSSIDIPTGIATTTLKLRMSTSTFDPTLIFSSGTAIYLREGTSTDIALNDSRVNVDSFSVLKLENPGGRATVQVNLAMSYNTSNNRAKFSRAIQLAVARISAATFDSDLVPNASNNYNLGSASFQWKDAFFAGNIGVGTSSVSAARIKAAGDIAVSTSSAGLILTSAGGTCYRITVTNTGAFSTSSVTCP